jgi:acetyl esterase/lipase
MDSLMISRRARFIRWITSRYIRRIDVRHADVFKLRRRLDMIGRLLMKAFRVKLERTTINGLYAEWLRPKKARRGKVLLYLHGGAYVMGSCRSHRQMVSHIARAAGIDALLPEYRLSPEHKFPDAINDAVGVYRELLASGFKPEDIIISGDSAGGGLTVATLDATASGESATTRADKDPWFRPEDMQVVIDYYCGADEARNPLVSPVFADVAGLPPVYIQVGDDEILLSDSTRFAAKMRESGGTVEIEIWPEMWHVFQLFIGKMPESRKAIRKIGAYVRERMKIGEPLET